MIACEQNTEDHFNLENILSDQVHVHTFLSFQQSNN